jgi:ParB family transcriptional regulator, chromosome partitioning protein
MSGASMFKKRPVASGQVAEAIAQAAASPMLADPREPVPAVATGPGAANLGSIQDHSDYEVGQTYEVPLGRIKSNPVNPKALYPHSVVDEMALSLQENGQITAANGYVDGAHVVLIEGETRFRGAKANGAPTLRIEIRPRPADEQKLYEEARAANKQRQDGSALDDAIRWKELIERKVYPNQAAIARALGLGEDEVSRTMQLGVLPQRIVVALSEAPNLLTGRMLNAIREYFTAAAKEDAASAEQMTLNLVAEVVKNDLGYRDVAARRKQLENGPVRRTRGLSEHVLFSGVKGEIKTFEEGGRIELSFKGLTAEQSQALAAKIKSALAA